MDEHNNRYPTDRIPSTITLREIKLIDGKRKYAKRIMPILWFDIYQYTTIRETRNGQYPLGRRALRTFLEEKKSIRIPNGFPDIQFNDWSVPEKMPVLAQQFPEWARTFIPSDCEAITILNLAKIINDDMSCKPEKYFTQSAMEQQFVKRQNENGYLLISWAQGTKLYQLFRKDCIFVNHLVGYVSWNRRLNGFTHTLMDLLSPKINERYYQLVWDYLCFRSSMK